MVKNVKKKRQPFFEKLKIAGIFFILMSPVIAWGIWTVGEQKIDVRTHQIVKRFMCICSMKCGLTLTSCDCPQKGGALEKKAYIRSMVKEGFSDAVIIERFYKKYGGLID